MSQPTTAAGTPGGRTLPVLIIVLIGAIMVVAADALLGQIMRNGFLELMDSVLDDEEPRLLPGTDRVIIRRFVGVPAVDRFLAMVNAFFSCAVDGSRPELSLFTFYFGAQLVTFFLVVMVESQRVVKMAGFLFNPVVWGLAMQMFGFGAVMPAFLLVHLIVTSKLSLSDTVRLRDPTGLHTVVPAFLLGYMLFAGLMVYPFPVEGIRQWGGALWQVYPLHVVVLQVVFTGVVKRLSIGQDAFKPKAQLDRAALGFPSDDSEDNDYDPDGQEVDEKNQTEGSSSEESELNHASDDLVTSPHNEQYLGLPSDDSEDNDYDPNAPDLDEQVKEETSSSDFTSDSEGFSVGRDDSTPLNKDYSPVSLLVDSSGSSERYTLENEKQTQTELQSISESDLNQENVTPVSGRRNKERLDYKKLHDEAYGNVSSDSSDDEDWNETDAPRKRKTSLGKDAVIPQEEKFINITNGTNTAGINQDLKEADNTQKRITPQKLKVEDENNSRSETHKINPETRSAEKNSTSPRTPPARSLGKAVTQRLSKSLRENEYPARATKENLAKELGITFRQVSKWFENARRSLRQSACMSEHGADTASPMGTAVIQMNGKFHELESKTDTGCNRVLNWESSKGDISNCATTGRKFEIGETSRQQSATPKSTKKRIRTSDENSHEDLSRKKTPPKGAPVNSPQSQALRRSSRISKQEESCPDVEMRTGRAVH